MKTVAILIPTYNRLTSLAMTLSGVALQEITNFHLVVADQSAVPADESRTIKALFRLIEARGSQVDYFHRPPVHGIAEQRDFLLKQAKSDYCLYLDDDVLMEPWVLERMVSILKREKCAFIGAFGAGLSFRNQVRPDQQSIEFWDGTVHPEAVEPNSTAWERWNIHRAANLYHIAERLPPGEFRLYKVAWVGGCVLYDRRKLIDVGGYSFWEQLPRFHSGEDVLVQNILMRRWGGCAMIPSGTYFAECETTVLNEAGSIDGHALELLPGMIARYASETAESTTGNV
ncbi:MAG: glycosyltransferase family 2 protein [Chloroflexi bacterium]|nr:MAG: glycosyltransferase family 2 protein [Chloroflexota bacterium]